jgi:DNA-binding MarR family transcriptional regulator
MDESAEIPPLGLMLRQAHWRAARAFSETLKPLGLENALAGVLIQLDRYGPQTQRQLIDRVGSEKSAMVRQIDQLEARGLARRAPHPTDRRAHAVELTDAGRELTAEIATRAERAQAELLNCLSPTERKLFLTVLQRFAEG